jgi:two-component system nitrogen regulation response regulator GlnG
MPHTVLICDDEEAIAWALRKAVEKQGHRAVVAASAEDALAKAKADPPDAAFLDIHLPGIDGLTALGRLRTLAPHTPVIVITAHGNLSTAVQAVAGGAFDYLAKPFDLDQALDALRRALDRTDPPATPQPTDDAAELVGRCPAMQSVFKRIALVAPTTASVLVTGESGTGKELVARAVHAHSPRAGKPFLPVHVAALNPNLVESELFGHVRGAFTGADRTRPGLLELADGGTVFLDELADIPLPVQAKLLRVLERQEVLPVGGAEPHRVNVRIVSATNADLSEAVNAGRFRPDLFFRLNVYPIHLPPLRDRPGDLSLLAERLLRQIRTPPPALTPEALTELERRTWPGNVRELKNALEHAAIVSRGEPIRPEHLPIAVDLGGPWSVSDKLAAAVRDWVKERVASEPGEPSDLYQRLLNEVEPALLCEVLAKLDGNRLVAARWLGLARATVRKLIRKYDLLPDGGTEADDGE